MTELSTDKKNVRCHICYATSVEQIDGFADLYRVTSDCQPWIKGGQLGICHSCGNVQKIIEQNYFEDCNKIYDSYKVYHQSMGMEQRVFEQNMGEPQARSEVLLQGVFRRFPLLPKGHLLDVGCGNGNLFRSFTRIYPKWFFSGLEVNELNGEIVRGIKNVEAFYSCDIKDIPEKFDLVTMVHCLEHIVDPVAFLAVLKEKIIEDGLLLIEVPDFKQNHFDLVIADHCSHFSFESLKQLLEVAGFEVLLATRNIIPKELTILARKISIHMPNKNNLYSDVDPQLVLDSLACLKRNVYEAYSLSKEGKLGILGTSIASTWLSCELDSLVSFYVDEDIDRAGQEFMGRKVYLPDDAPSDGHVFLALPFEVAEKIWERMLSCKCNFYLPPCC